MSDKIKRFTKKIIAAALVLTLVGGAAVTGTVIDFAPASITVNAAGTTQVAYTIDESGTLTIKAGTYENPYFSINEGKDTVKNITSEAGVIFTGDCLSLFSYFSLCESIDVSNADFSEATSLKNLFAYNSKLKSVKMAKITTSNLTNTSSMFSICPLLENLDLDINTSNVTDMSYMFYDCTALQNVDFGDNFKTDNGNNFEYMFAYCYALTELDLSKLSFAAATDMESMFRSCSSLKELNFGNDIDTGNVQYFDSMFYDCSSLNKINGLTKFNTLSATSFSSMFYGCTSLSELDLSSFDASNAVSANPDYYSDVMFSSSGIRTITISDKFPIKKNAELLNTGAVDNAKSAVLGWIVNGDQSGQIISGGDEYAEINGAGTYIRKTSELKWSYDIFDGSEGGKRALTLEEGEYNSSILESIKTECGHMLEAYNEEHGTNYNVDNYWEPEVFSYIVNDGVTFFGNCSDMFDARYTGHSVSLEFKGHIVTQHLTNMAGMFEGSESAPFTITGLDLNDYDTSEVTDMSRLFVGLDVEELNVSSFDTRNVEKMVGMFKNVKAKKIIFGDKFDTSKVYAMGGMFRDSKVAALNLSGFNTANVGKIPENTSLDSDEEGMKAMFSGCESLTTLDLSSFNTTSVTTMENMFSGCTGLEDIIFGNDFNIKGITYDGISGMFRDCSSLTNIDFSTFVGSESNTPANSISDMFNGCSSLKTVDLSSVKLDNVQSVSDAFSGCSSLEAVTLPVLSQYSYFYDAFDGCTRLCNLSLPVGSKINEYSKLPNKNAVFTGWHKSDSAEIVSGTGKYAEFTVEKTEATDSDIVTYLRDYAEYNNCIVNGASLTLEGQIGLNFYAVFPKDVLQDPDSYVLLSGPEGDQKIMLNDAGFDIDNGFRFTYKLSAAQLKDKVTFSVYSTGGNKQILLKDNNGTPVSTGDANTYSFSIQDYVNTVKQNESDYDYYLVKLVKAIETYGTYAQLYFDYNRDSANTTGLVSIDNINADNMYYNSFYISDGIPQDLKFEGYSLVLDSETKLKFYFSCDDIKKHTFTVGGKKLTPVSAGDNKYYVAIENISAKNLRKQYYLYIDGNTEYIYTYPLSYARTAVRKYQNSNNAKKLELCNVMRALYRYSEAAYDYFGSPDYD